MSVLVPLLWSLWFTAGSSVQPHQVVAVVGEAVILPCSLENRALFDDSPTVEWTRADLKPKAALVYRDNCEVFEMKHQRFEFRTSLFYSEVKHGNVSLRISDVQLSDAGTFYCLKIPKEDGRVRKKNSTVELVVVSAFDPKITVISFGSENVVMECEASCWLPKPQMKILDDQGRSLTGDETQTEDPRGCSTIKQRVTLQHSAHSHRIFCRVELPQVNHSRTTQILISEDTNKMGRGVQLCAANCWAFNATIAVIVVVIFLGLFLLKKKLQRCAEACLPRKTSGICVTKSSLEHRNNSCETENNENSFTEQQERELKNLKLELQDKDQLIANLKRQLFATQQSRVVCQHDKPTITQKAPIDASKNLDSFENGASSSENDQEPLESHKLLKSSGFSHRKHQQADILGMKRDSVPGGKGPRKKPLIRLKSFPSYEKNDDTLSSLLSSSPSSHNNFLSQRRPSSDPSASRNKSKKAFDKFN